MAYEITKYPSGKGYQVDFVCAVISMKIVNEPMARGFQSKREAIAFGEKMDRDNAEALIWLAEELASRRAHRLEAVNAYLAKRARRPVEIQLNLF